MATSTEKSKVKVTATQASAITGLSEEQIADYRKAFTHFDKNKNGTICLSEFKDVIAHLSDKIAATLFKTADLDGKDDLDFNEFIHAMAVLLNTKPSDIPVVREMRRFERMDEDGNGVISKKELKEVLGKYFSEAEVNDVLTDFDKDGDGQISVQEFLKTNIYYNL